MVDIVMVSRAQVVDWSVDRRSMLGFREVLEGSLALIERTMVMYSST